MSSAERVTSPIELDLYMHGWTIKLKLYTLVVYGNWQFKAICCKELIRGHVIQDNSKFHMVVRFSRAIYSLRSLCIIVTSVLFSTEFAKLVKRNLNYWHLIRPTGVQSVLFNPPSPTTGFRIYLSLCSTDLL